MCRAKRCRMQSLFRMTFDHFLCLILVWLYLISFSGRINVYSWIQQPLSFRRNSFGPSSSSFFSSSSSLPAAGDDDTEDTSEENNLEIQNSFDLQRALQNSDNTMRQIQKPKENTINEDLLFQLQEIASNSSEEELEGDNDDNSEDYIEGDILSRLFNDENLNLDDGNDNDTLQNPLDLQRQLSYSNSTFPPTDPNNPDSLKEKVLAQLQAIASKNLYGENGDYDPNLASNLLEENDIEDDSVFLDADAYVQASNSLRPDGSLPDFIFEQETQSNISDENKSSTNTNEIDPTIQDLIDLVKDKRKRQEDNPIDLDQAKAMRDKIFDGEEAFLNQSKEFLEGLGGDTNAAKEATSKRRDAQYRKEQSKEEEKLDQALDEWEDQLIQQQEEKGNESTTDIPEGEWIKVDDPITEETFFWNSETGEMKWELEDETQSE